MNNGFIMVIISMLIWGSLGIFVRGINQPSEIIVFFRVSIAFIFMLAMYVIKNKKGMEIKKIRKNTLLKLIISGIFISLNWMFFFKALKTTTVAAATLSYYTSPVIVTVLSVFLLKEKINIKAVIALFLSFLGIFIMIFNSNNMSNFNITGVIYGLIAALFYALTILSVKKLEEVSSEKIIIFQMGVASVLFLPFLKNMNPLDLKSTAFLLIIGVVHTCFALFIYFEGVKKIKIQYVSILSYIDPLSSVVFAAVILYEIPSIATIIGGLLILISTVFVLKLKE